MLKTVCGHAILASRRRRTCLKVVACFVVVSILALYIYRQPGRLSAPVRDRAPLASFIHRPHQRAATVSHAGIPKIIHQTWKSRSDLPETFRAWMASWLRHNGDWQYWLWTDADIRRLISTVFPQYLSLFDSYPTNGYRVDIFRRAAFANCQYTFGYK